MDMEESSVGEGGEGEKEIRGERKERKKERKTEQKNVVIPGS